MIFGDDGPVELVRAFLQQALEGAADIAFVVEIAAAEAVQGFVISLYWRVGRL